MKVVCKQSLCASRPYKAGSRQLTYVYSLSLVKFNLLVLGNNLTLCGSNRLLIGVRLNKVPCKLIKARYNPIRRRSPLSKLTTRHFSLT